MPREPFVGLVLSIAALAALFLFMFAEVSGRVAHRVDDISIVDALHSPDLQFFPAKKGILHKYVVFASGRGFLLKAYGVPLELCGENLDCAYVSMLGVYGASAVLLFFVLRSICPTLPAVLISAFYLSFWQKQEALIDFSGTAYSVVITMFLLALWIERLLWPLWVRGLAIGILLWLSMHLYEVLVIAPVFFLIIWFFRLALDERRLPRIREVVAMLLPVAFVGVHVLILAGVGGTWYTRNPTSWNAYGSTINRSAVAFLNGFAALFGREASTAWRQCWISFLHNWYAAPVPIIALLSFTLLLLAIAALYGSERYATRGVAGVTPGYLGGLVVGGAFLVFVGPMPHMALGLDNGCPGRFLFLPSVGGCLVLAGVFGVCRHQAIRGALVIALFVLVTGQALCMRAFFRMNADAARWDEERTRRIADFRMRPLDKGKVFAIFAMNGIRDKVPFFWTRTYSLYEQGNAAMYFWRLQNLGVDSIAYQPIRSSTLTLEALQTLAGEVRAWRENRGGPVAILYFDDHGRVWGIAGVRDSRDLDPALRLDVRSDVFPRELPDGVKYLDVTAGPGQQFQLSDAF